MSLKRVMLAVIPALLTGDALAQSSSQERVVEGIADDSARSAIEEELGRRAPAFPEGFVTPSLEPDPNRTFTQAPMVNLERAQGAAPGLDAVRSAPEVSLLGASAESYSGRVNLTEVVPGHVIARASDGAFAIEIRLPTDETAGAAVPERLLADQDPGEPAEAQLDYEKGVTAGLSLVENVVLSRDGEPTFVQIDEGGQEPHNRSFEDFGLHVTQLPPPAPGEEPVLSFRFGDDEVELAAGETARLSDGGSTLEVIVLGNFYRLPEERNTYFEGEPYHVSYVARRVS